MEENNKHAHHSTEGDSSLAKDAATRVLSLVSHKLKTPLSIINGYSEAILSTVKPEEMSSFNIKALEDINKQGEKLSVLVCLELEPNLVFIFCTLTLYDSTFISFS